MHQAWLTSDIAARYNEAVSYPYTSLKYHTLLVAALLDNYRNGHHFNDVHLAVDDVGTIIPHRTIYAGDEFALRITAADVSQPSARLGQQPQRSWASTWTQLPAHPLDTDYDQRQYGLGCESATHPIVEYRTPVHRGLHGIIPEMTQIQQVHWELDMDYLGHPYYVSGNAIMHAIGQRLPQDRHQHLHASHGMFVPGQFGTFPSEHSKHGFQPYLGTGLPDVECYADLFVHRHPAHTWLLDSRPRDALNTHDIRRHSGQPGFAHETIMGRPSDTRKQQQTTKWYINAYLHADHDNILPLGEDVLDRLQFGGKRNYGYGTTHLKATQLIDLDTLNYSRLRDSQACRLELVKPFVLASTYPNAAPTPSILVARGPY